MFPGWRPIPARVLASSTAFTPQLGATFAWQRMCTFILQTVGRAENPRSGGSHRARGREPEGPAGAAGASRGLRAPSHKIKRTPITTPGISIYFCLVQKQTGWPTGEECTSNTFFPIMT